MTQSAHKKEIEDLAMYAGRVFGMKAWVSELYARIVLAKPQKNIHVSPLVVYKACQKLIADDSGSVDPLVAALAKELVRLNSELRASSGMP